MRERRWLALALYGFLLATAVSGALKATRPKFKIATTSTTTEQPAEAGDEETEVTTVSSEVNATTGHTLTGIPQIDYIWDPNLPRELNGYNLSEYPFYNSIPEDIDFKCDGLHDGFYASVPHKCQVYHHCLYGTRYDFLCANFTAFDQKTFICHFVSEVDCVNSKKYWHRNDALYQAASTTTTSTTTTTTTTTTTPTPQPVSAPPAPRGGSRRRRPFRRRPYDYYDDEYYDEEYDRTRPRGYDRRDEYEYEERKYSRRDRDRDRDFRDRDRDFRDREREAPRARDPDRPSRDRESLPRERFPARSNRRDPARGAKDPLDDDLVAPGRSRVREPDDVDADGDDRRTDTRARDSEERRYGDKRYRDEYDDKEPAASAAASAGSTEGLVKPVAPSTSVYARPRTPPKIRRPVPLSEQEKYAYKATSTAAPAGESRRRPVAAVDPVDDYYDEDDLEEVRPRRPIRRRPAHRDRDRDLYEAREPVRDRERDRPFRSRYQDEDDDVRPRKYPERSRDRYYDRDRERDRGLDRGRDRSLDRGKDRERGRSQDRDGYDHRLRPAAPSSSRSKELTDEPSRPSSRSKEQADSGESTRRPSIYDRTTTEASETHSSDASRSPSSSSSATSRSKEHVEKEDEPVKSSGSSSGSSSRSKEHLESNEPSRKPSIYDRTTTEAPQSTTAAPVAPVDEERSHLERPGEPSRRPAYEHEEEEEERVEEKTPERPSAKDQSKPQQEPRNYDEREEDREGDASHQLASAEEYSSEYYDEPEDPPPSSSPRTTVRIVKRPFLPSRGGNPNPRGLSPVGGRVAVAPRREEDPPSSRPRPTDDSKTDYVEREREREEELEQQTNVNDSSDRKNLDNRQPYDAYKAIQTDLARQKQRPEESVIHRPLERGRNDEDHSRLAAPPTDPEVQGSGRNAPRARTEGDQEEHYRESQQAPSDVHRVDEQRERDQVTYDNPGVPVSSGSPPLSRGKVRYPATESNLYSSTYKSEDIRDPTAAARPKPKINEVAHRLQDIPESEYDVTLNDALTPALNQESNLPSGFVLPLHRQLGRDTVLQSSENNYRFSRPLAQQPAQKPFIPSPQYVPSAPINDRGRTVYFRTPEVVPVGVPQYRPQRGPWQDYTGY